MNFRARPLFCIAVIFILAITPIVARSQETDPKVGVQEDYDKFKDKTFVNTVLRDVKLSNSSKAREVGFTAIFSYPGHVPQKPSAFTVSLGIVADEQLFSSYGEKRLIVLADGKRVFYDTMILTNTKIGPGGVFQLLGVEFPFYVFREIAEAKLVEAQVGTIEFQLTDGNLRDIRELVRRATP